MTWTQNTTALVAGAAALFGFASGANASATVDLVWIDASDRACLDVARRDCPQLGSALSSAGVSDEIALAVLITAGPNGVLGAAVSVDYSDVLPHLSVSGFGSLTTPPYLTATFGETTHQLPFIDNIVATAMPSSGVGIGLPPGRSAYLGTVSFHTDQVIGGEFEIAVGTNGPGGTDVVLDRNGRTISATTAFNGAILRDPRGQCPFDIEVSSLRVNGKTVRTGPNETADVAAKARIVKGTAPSGTTLDATLTIDARDGATLIGRNSTAFEAVRLETGTKGTGDKLAVLVPLCVTGFIEFTATFSGEVDSETQCIASRTLRRECE